MVTTGQQAGLLTGPLYTIYKALTVVRLAESLEHELGVIVLPVFWTASEDHDWAEVNHVYLVDAADELRRLELATTDTRALPMAQRPLGRQVKQFLDEVAELLSRQPFAPEVLDWIQEAYMPEQTVASAFSRMLGTLLAPFDVLLTDAAEPNLKVASRPILRQALEQVDQHSVVLRDRSGHLLEHGYHTQVALLDGATNVFYHGFGQRERIDRKPGGFVLHDSGRTFDGAALLEELDARPELFSPNVLLRPVVESAVFPTLGYVGGPGEISYFAQLNALFPEFGMAPPVVFPRVSATLVEPAVQRLIGKLNLSAPDLARPRHELETQLARNAMPTSLRVGVADLARSVTDGYRRLIEEAVHIDPSLQGALGALRNESLARVGESERKIVQRLKEREAATLAQLDRVRAHLRPNGEPQERVLNVAPYLARYGPDLLKQIAARMSISWVGVGVSHARELPDTSL